MSCTNNGNNNLIETKMEISKKEPVILDSVSIMKYTADELIERNGIPASEEIFSAFTNRRDRKSIMQFYSKNSKEKIRELVWNIDSVSYVVIWYAKKKDTWRALTFDFRDVRAEY
jgi:hypothetical protein